MSRGYDDCDYRGTTESYSTTCSDEDTYVICSDEDTYVICSDEDTYVVETPYVVGISAYEIAVADGFEGTIEEWLESLKAAIPVTLDDSGKFLSNDGENTIWQQVSYSEENFTTENKEALDELISGNYVWKETAW